jgi:glycosyltransferase involved in cell wall biosynthesis
VRLRILITSSQPYPASVGGFAGCRIFDFLAKGLAENGHDVFYYLPGGTMVPTPPGVKAVSRPVFDVDIVHVQGRDLHDHPCLRRKPWVRTCHVDLSIKGEDRSVAAPNWIFVSRTLAETYGSNRYVLNGVDPSELIYAEAKHDYFLFVCGLDRAIEKGLDTALDLSRRIGFRLVVAGSSRDPRVSASIAEMCRENGAEFAGEVWGTSKATLFAHARALLFPTKWNESFGLVIAEALMSGTPVIASDRGACPELVTPDAGFVCSTAEDYVAAIARTSEIRPAACRAKAMAEFHYLRMAAEYVREYERETGSFGVGDAFAVNARRYARPTA